MAIIDDYPDIHRRMLGDPLVIKAVVVVTPQDCMSGSCGCASAANCKFSRCDNCDNILHSPSGKAYNQGPSHAECPNCGGDCR
jgi:hypothetical protein